MSLMWITLVCVSGLIQADVSCEVNQTVVKVARGENLQLSCCENQNVSWWKDGQRLSNSTGGQMYSREGTQFSDGGDYFCNNTNAGQSFHVRVGEKPPPPPPTVCFASPNSTILCTATKNSYLSDMICITVETRFFKPDVCKETLRDSLFIIDLDDFVCLNNCTVVVNVSNDYGYATRHTNFKNGLSDKVFPDPPRNVNLLTIRQFTFRGSFSVPDTWKTESSIFYEYRYTHLNKTHSSEEIHSEKNNKTVQFEFTLQNSSVIWAEVCLQVRFRFGFIYSPTWSDYSRSVCNYTREGAPSEPPQNFTVAEDRRKETPGLVKFSWEPPPKGKRNGFIQRYELIVEESDDGSAIHRNWSVAGNETQITLRDVLEEDRAYEVYLAAFTSRGKSPEAVQTLKAHQRIPVVVWILLSVTSSVALILLFRVSWILHHKMQAEHLPEPYQVLPEIKMLHMLQTIAKKGPPPHQKEVFDTLRSKDNETIPAIPKMDDDDNYNTGEPQTPPVGEEFEWTDSGVLLGSSTYSSSGVRSYSLMSTSGTMTPDGLNVHIKENEPSLDSLPTSPVPSEGTSDPSSYVRHSELNCNDSGCYTKSEGQFDPNYDTTLDHSGTVRIHDTLQMLIDSQSDYM